MHDCGTDCGTAALGAIRKAAFISRRTGHFWLARAPYNRKRPSGEEGRFWGYYREERYVSLYMWICGRWVSPVCAVGAVVGSNGAICTARGST